MLVERVDVEYWCKLGLLTVWQAAFIMNDLEPWDEPISSNTKPPAQVEKMRTILLANIAHYETGQLFARDGWSCKAQRPAQLSGLYYDRQSLCQWATGFFTEDTLPLVFQK